MIKMTTLLFLALAISCYQPSISSAQSSVPTIPGCICSQGTEINYPSSSVEKVFAANCICGPQYCAATWNKTISLQCIGGAENIGARPNCADFTKMKVGNYGRTMTAGLFRVDALFTSSENKDLIIRVDEVNTTPIGTTPNGLRTAPGSEFTYPTLYRRAVIDLAVYMGGGNRVSIVTGNNVVVNFPFPATPIHGVTSRITVEHADGIKSLRFPENEILVFEVCAE